MRLAPDELWLDRFARRLGFGWLAARLPWQTPPSVLYAVVTVPVFTAALQVYRVAEGGKLIYEINPYMALQPVILVGGAVAAHLLHRSYGRVADEMNLRERAADPGPLVAPIPRWLAPGLFALAVVLQLLRAVFGPGYPTTADLVANVVVLPFVYAPIVAQFSAVYLAIEFVAPYRIARSDVGVHFLDPQGVGGLRPLGELVKTAYYYIVAGLVGYALITYAPFVDTAWQVSAYAGGLFTAVWLVSVATVGFAVFTLHRFMHREKREEIQRLEAELHDCIENPYDVASYEIPDGQRDRVEDIRERIAQVDDTKEYPATFSIWTQLLLSVAIPKALQLLLAST